MYRYGWRYVYMGECARIRISYGYTCTNMCLISGHSYVLKMLSSLYGLYGALTCAYSQPPSHYNDVIMTTMAYQITSLTNVYSTIYSRHRSKKTSKLHVTGLCEGIHRWIPLTKGQWRGKCFPFDGVTMMIGIQGCLIHTISIHHPTIQKSPKGIFFVYQHWYMYLDVYLWWNQDGCPAMCIYKSALSLNFVWKGWYSIGYKVIDNHVHRIHHFVPMFFDWS